MPGRTKQTTNDVEKAFIHSIIAELEAIGEDLTAEEVKTLKAFEAIIKLGFIFFPEAEFISENQTEIILTFIRICSRDIIQLSEKNKPLIAIKTLFKYFLKKNDESLTTAVISQTYQLHFDRYIERENDLNDADCLNTQTSKFLLNSLSLGNESWIYWECYKIKKIRWSKLLYYQMHQFVKKLFRLPTDRVFSFLESNEFKNSKDNQSARFTLIIHIAQYELNESDLAYSFACDEIKRLFSKSHTDVKTIIECLRRLAKETCLNPNTIEILRSLNCGPFPNTPRENEEELENFFTSIATKKSSSDRNLTQDSTERLSIHESLMSNEAPNCDTLLKTKGKCAQVHNDAQYCHRAIHYR